MTSSTQSPVKSAALPIEKGGPEKDTPAQKEFSPQQLLLGAFFGVLFGFFLQKGGVAKYHVLIGALLLEDFTVMKVMLTAIVVGCVGVFSLHALGLVKLHIKPTRYAANIIGGLLFGVGFALLGYCPGTGAEQCKANAEQQPADDVRGVAGWFDVQLHVAQRMQAENPDAPHDDGRQHHLHDREVFEEQRSKEHRVFRDATLLQEEAKEHAEECPQ